VRDLTGLGPGDRLDVLRPPPSRLEGAAADRVAADVDDVGLALALELADLVRRVEALDL
jgi:hypothetical protein